MGRESRYLAGHAGPLSSLLEYGPLGMSCPHAGVNQCLGRRRCVPCVGSCEATGQLRWSVS